MNPAEKETIKIFCRELALALRRITGKVVEIRPEELPMLADEQDQQISTQQPPTITTPEENQKP
jgi:hypothetical protein